MKTFIKKLLYTIAITTIWASTIVWYTNAETWFFDTSYVSWYAVPKTNAAQDDELLNVIQRTVNRVLWMLSLVALILCLRGWFQMLIAWSDDWKVKSWTKVLKNAAIGLAVIWLSWLIVSFIFWIIKKVTNS